MPYYGTMQPVAPMRSQEQPIGDLLLGLGLSGAAGDVKSPEMRKKAGGNSSEILKMLAAMGGNGPAPIPDGAAQPGIDPTMGDLRPMVDPGLTGLPPGTMQPPGQGGQSGVLEALLRRLNPGRPVRMGGGM
jgi:hypothetical protein